MQLDGVHGVNDLVDGLVDLGGSGDAGVAQRVVIHIFGAHYSGLLQTVGKQLTNDRGGSTQVIELLINHNTISFLFYD